jgi:formate dehydrogenase subunit gamma
MTRPPDRDAPLLRFDRVERVLHWVNALAFGTLMLTGATLYAGPLSGSIGHRELVRTIHVTCGLLLPVPVLLAVIGRHGRGLRTDLRRLNRWAPGEARWFRRHTRTEVRLGKFNPGQKLNAAFVAAAGVVMLATGSIMHWFDAFPIDWRTGATFVHDWFAIGLWLVVLGHITLALRDPETLHGMWWGTVSAGWARRHAPRWYREMRAEDNVAATAASAHPEGAFGGRASRPGR